MRAWASALVVTVFCIACNRETQTQQPLDVAINVVNSRDSVVLERPYDCKDPVSECSVVEIHLPVFSSQGASGNRLLAFTLNRAVRDFYVDALGGAVGTPMSESDTTSSMPNVIDAARLLLGDYEEFKAKYPSSPLTWVVQGTGKVTAADSLVCVELLVDAFTGGAHGNASTGFVVANSKTGKRVQAASLIRNVTMFTDSAERAFRILKNIGSSEDLSDHNYFLESNKFVLPENIGLSTDSVILYYNTYEIAPYALGPTRLAMPRSALQIH